MFLEQILASTHATGVSEKCRTCLYEVVADVGFSDHWQDVCLTPLHGLAPPTERIDQQQQATRAGQQAFAEF